MRDGSTLSTNEEMKVSNVTSNGGTHTRDLTFDPLLVSHGGQYKCEAGSQTETQTVNVQLPVPLDPPQFNPPARITEYYSAAEFILLCLFAYSTEVTADPGMEIFITWIRNGSPIKQNDRIEYMTGPTFIQGSSGTYSAQLDMEYLAQADSDLYNCNVTTYPVSNAEYVLANATLKSGDFNLEVLIPVPVVSVSAQSIRVPNHPDYNTAIITCTDRVPVEELAFDKEYSWTMDGADVTSLATNPVDPDEQISSGQLHIQLTDIGDVVFVCTVSIQVPDDPLISANNSLTITVVGPAQPGSPVDIHPANITYITATIHWTVPMITYTQEQYIVYYGTSQTSLTSSSAVVTGSSNYSSINTQYLVDLTGLEFNTLYYYRLRVNNTEGNVESDLGNFTTLSIEVPDGAPRNFTSTATGPEVVSLRWRSVEESLRNADIVSYTVNCNSSQAVITAVPSKEEEEAWYSYNMTGLLPYTLYLCEVYASNNGGPGPRSTALVRTFEDKPLTPPTNVLITGRSESSVNVSWSRPSVPNGIITMYTVYIDFSNGTTQFISVVGSTTKFIISELRPYQTVQVGVSASTTIGEGPRSAVSSGRSLEAAPDAIAGVGYYSFSSTLLRVNFTTPTLDTTHGVVLHYVLSVRIYDGGIINTHQIIPAEINSLNTFDVTGLQGEVPYVVSLYAVNSAGNGETTSKTLFTREGVPPPPSGVTVNRLDGGRMNVSWDPIPLTRARGFITSYTISYSRSVSRGKRQSVDLMVPGDMTSVLIEGLSASARYSVTVNAATSAGAGEESSEQTVEELQTPQEEGLFTTMNVIIISCSVAVLIVLVIIVIVIIATMVYRRRGNGKSADLPQELKIQYIAQSNEIEMGASLAYGQITNTPEPDEEFEPFKKPRITTQNPTYNSAYSNAYEHTYESIDNIVGNKGRGFESYDVPKPTLPAPRTTNGHSESDVS